MQLGAKTGCHQQYSRSLCWKGYQFPLCARCTGLLAGQLLGYALAPLFLIVWLTPLWTSVLSALVATILLGIDGLGQYRGRWESTNRRRLVTGLLCGCMTGILFVRLLVLLACEVRAWFL